MLGCIQKETKTESDDISYSYDSNNTRKEMRVGNKTTAYLYNKNDELFRTDTLNSDTEKDSVVIYKNDKNGNQLATVKYDSFGNEVNPDRKDGNPFRYCGEYYDKETDTIYFWARYYQPYLGRFLTRDTYIGDEEDSLTLHLYTYCGNDGVNNVDPSGNIFETIFDVVSLADSVYSMVTQPSWENAGFLAWDAVSLFPGVPGSYVVKGSTRFLKAAGKEVKVGRKVGKIAKTSEAAAKKIRKLPKIKRVKVLGKNKKYLNKVKKLKIKKSTKIKKVSVKVNKKVVKKTQKNKQTLNVYG